jgi:DeoR/GlpR family transcriptional regulator of sugar metabolism
MLPAERHDLILAHLGARGSLKTRDLRELVEASEETIRLDLIELEKRGQLVRVHGGAKAVGSKRYALPLPEREALHRQEKARIAQRAASLIKLRETCFLDASSTVLAMTSFLPEIEATVLTNAGHVVAALADREHVDLVCTGGDYERRSRSYTGILAEEAVQRYHMHRMFLGVDGLDPDRGASEMNAGQARLKERLLPLADEVILLADASKLGRRSAFFFGRARQFDRLITDKAAPLGLINALRKAGVSVETV